MSMTRTQLQMLVSSHDADPERYRAVLVEDRSALAELRELERLGLIERRRARVRGEPSAWRTVGAGRALAERYLEIREAHRCGTLRVRGASGRPLRLDEGAWELTAPQAGRLESARSQPRTEDLVLGRAALRRGEEEKDGAAAGLTGSLREGLATKDGRAPEDRAGRTLAQEARGREIGDRERLVAREEERVRAESTLNVRMALESADHQLTMGDDPRRFETGAALQVCIEAAEVLGAGAVLMRENRGESRALGHGARKSLEALRQLGKRGEAATDRSSLETFMKVNAYLKTSLTRVGEVLEREGHDTDGVNAVSRAREAVLGVGGTLRERMTALRCESSLMVT